MSNDVGRGVRQEQACGCVNANAKEVATVQSSADLRPQAPLLGDRVYHLRTRVELLV